MHKRMLLSAGAAALVLAGCSRSSETNSPVNASHNEQTGVTTTPQGLQGNAAAAVAECVPPEDRERSPSDLSLEQRRQILGCINAATARQLNAQLPRQFDPVTRLDRLSTEGATLIYHYTILRPASSLSPELVRQLEAHTRASACAQADMRNTLASGGSYAYRWVDNRGVLITELRLESC